VLDSGATLRERLDGVLAAVGRACERSGRDPRGVRLVAVAKGQDVEAVRAAVAAGVEDVGENYVRELAEKATEVPGPRWHFVGTLQASTAHRVASLADVVHSAVPGHAAERLSSRADREDRRLPSLLQVDFTGSRGRSGVPAEHAPEAVRELAALPGLELVGLMTLPPAPGRPEDSRPHFRRLRELRDDLARGHDGLVELSMGMSGDYEVAVEEGATMIRIGTALFGERSLAST
jgi:PLP dependent protein